MTKLSSSKTFLNFAGIWKNDLEAARKAEEAYKERKKWKLKINYKK